MALFKNELQEQLLHIRTTIRKKHFEETGEEMLVCSDYVIQEMASKKPTKQRDLLAISEVDNHFLEKYSRHFLVVIDTYVESQVKTIRLSKSAQQVIKHYKDRLANISKNNHNLYLGKIDATHSFDLTHLDSTNDLNDFVRNQRTKQLKLSFKEDKSFDSITKLYREVNKTFKEKGSYSLYIAYPFIEGVFKKEKFPIKAPLLYYPVRLERTLKTFTLKKDNERDIVFNRDLLLTLSKLNKTKPIKDLPQIIDMSEQTMNQIVLPLYESYGLNINRYQEDLQYINFKNMLKDDFMKNTKSSFMIKPYITLSRFELYSSSVQTDMDKILATNKYNDLLEGLIDEKDIDSREQGIPPIDIKPVRESQIKYINDLNFSQEKVIELLNKEKKLVIWGPPGTGKSQTITSLIASSILNGENVLVVSEKKVALEVIYSRLKRAAKYAIFLDDAENKQVFYDQFKKILDPEPPVRTENNDIYSHDIEIEETLITLEESLKLLYKNQLDGLSVHELYYRYIKDKDVVNELKPLHIFNLFNQTFKKPKFQFVLDIEKKFKTDKFLSEMIDLYRLFKKFPYLRKIDTAYTRSHKLIFKEFHDKYLEALGLYTKAGFFKKRKIVKSIVNLYSGQLNFISPKVNMIKRLIHDMFMYPYLENYIWTNLSSLNKKYQQYHDLNKNEISYLMMLSDAKLFENVPDIYKYRTYIMDEYFTGFLEDFKAKNQSSLYILDKYQSKIDELSKNQDTKMRITLESFEMELYKHALDLSNTKRIMDIKRILDGTNKPSVQSFIEKFNLEIQNHIRLFMMTPEVISATLPLIHGMFDLVIFDEASQMFVEKGIPGIYRAKKVVIAGDPKQLRPSSLGIGRLEDSDNLYEEDAEQDITYEAKSLLDLARFRFKEALLNYHYRSEYEELIAFSNHAFYDAKLMIAPNQSNPDEPPITYHYVKDGRFIQRSNVNEAKEVVKIIQKIFRERKNNESIGVITFNSPQRDMIMNEIDQMLFKRGTYQKAFEQELFRKDNDQDTSLFVKNIENVQGDERDIIIFSMGYAKNELGILQRQFGWLNQEGGKNRLNVAITRAKKKIYFVSSLYPEEFKVDDLSSTGPKLLKDFMRYCYFVSHKNNAMTKEVLKNLYLTDASTKEALISVMIDDLSKRLEKLGYQVEHHIGIGKYRIDLAVKKDNQSYQLGIISSLDKAGASARKDFLHQEKYLHSRNWKIYRLFESNWFTDPQKELKNIKDLLKN